MLKRVLKRLKQWLHIRSRARKVKKGEKALGGMRVRISHRLKRQLKIQKEKSMVIEDLHRSWKIGEIKPAVKEDIETLQVHRERIPWSVLLDIKRKYWHENI